MTKRLLVNFLTVASLAALTACSGGGNIQSKLPSPGVAPVELEVVQAPKAESPAVHNELLDPEFGCSGGGSLEYGVVQRPKKN